MTTYDWPYCSKASRREGYPKRGKPREARILSISIRKLVFCSRSLATLTLIATVQRLATVHKVRNKHRRKMHSVHAAAASLTWCVSSPINLSPVLNNRSARSSITFRRPRTVYRSIAVASASSASSAENSVDETDATQVPPPPPAPPRQLSYQEFSLPADYQLKISATSFSLLTDSVLEAKWKNDENRKASGVCADESDTSTDDCCVAPADPETSPAFETVKSWDDDLSASDPYKAFARFTRIAAPTATLDQATEGSLGDKPTLLESKLSDGVPTTPYSTASIVHRLLWYTRARQNMLDFVTFFCGDFDNADQIADERSRNILPGEGGGHEHIHCKIEPIGNDMLFARYYFNGEPTRVFRTRVYSVSPGTSGRTGIVEMRIFRLYEEAEQRLRESGYDLTCISWEDEGDREKTDMYEWMRGCEVFWERYTPENDEDDEARHVLGICGGDRFIGFMKGGGCEVFSKIIGQRLIVMDDLLLTSEDLWVADRGFDESGNFVYGNRRGIPYKMRRIVEGSPHSWTLSPSEGPPEGYIP